MGGAHALLAVAATTRPGSCRGTASPLGLLARTAWRVALPSALWIGTLALSASDYAPATALFLNGARRGPLDARLAVLVPRGHRLDLVGLAAVLAIPPSADWSTRTVRLGAGAGRRRGRPSLRPGRRRGRRRPSATPDRSSWCFALGWAAARAGTTRSAASSRCSPCCLTFGFFGDAGASSHRGRRSPCSSGRPRSVCPRGWPRSAAPWRRPRCRSISRTGRSTRTWRWTTRCSRRSRHIVVGLAYHRLSTPVVDGIERAVARIGRALTSARRGPTLSP